MMYYLHGGAGAPNFGDELIARQWLEFLGENAGMPIVFSGYRRHVMKTLYSKRYPSVYLTDALCKYQTTCTASFWDAFTEGYNFLENIKRSDKISKEEVDILRKSKVFHLHGGGYINTMWPKHAFYLGLAASLRRNLDCKIIGTGLGLIPIPAPPTSKEQMLSDAISSFDVLELRDRDSYLYIKSFARKDAKVVLGLDDVFLMPVVTNGKGGTIHLSIHSNKHGDGLLDKITDAFMSDFKRHIFWVCHYKDIAQFERVSSRWPFVEKATYESLTFEPLPIGPGDYVITSRFHPHLMAARAGAQGQYLAPGAYSTTKHNSVVELGSTFTKIDDLWIATSWKSDGSSNAKMTSADPARVAAKRKLWKDAIKPDPEATKKAKGKASARS